jgi:homoaconitate hydratase
MGQTIVEKIAEYHLSDAPPDRPVKEGNFVSIWPRHVLTHDNTAAVMKKFEGLSVNKVRAPRQPVFVLDHDIQNRSKANLDKYRAIEAFARDHGLDFYPAGTGIGHQVMVEGAYVLPGSFVVASDSHANMYGALGAVGTPVVRTDAAMIWATGEFWWQIPRTIQVVLEGCLPTSVTGKDVILALCGLYNKGEVLNAAVEFSGPGIASLSMEDRLTISNMTTEWGALVGWFPVDETTLEYLRERSKVLARQGASRLSAAELEEFRKDPPRPDLDASYAARITLDLGHITPCVSGPDNVQTVAPLDEIEKRRIKIHKAYIVSCVNSRPGDLQSAAEVLDGGRIAPGVELYVAPASKEVQELAEKNGSWQALLDAGATPLPPGCGPCIGLGAGLLEPGEVGISATNRNFKGRMGSPESNCYLASPPVVAASALAGYIAGPEHRPLPGIKRRIEIMPRDGRSPAEGVEIIEGFPPKVRGRLVFLPTNNLNTDGIYGKDYTYREDMTVEDMAGVVMENYDPSFAEKTKRGDILVAGYNFGTGSSREQAVTALMAKGYPMVIAGSFSQTYLRNAFNNGFICLESAELSDRLRKEFAGEAASGRKFIIPGGDIEVDFASGSIHWLDSTFMFPPLGRVPQSLVVAGGVESLVREGSKAV